MTDLIPTLTQTLTQAPALIGHDAMAWPACPGRRKRRTRASPWFPPARPMAKP